MKDLLAERLLAKVMGWTAEDVARERPDLQALASVKYDGYQQFSPGRRFIESLALWLEQFGNVEDRNAAYRFVRSRLIFVSETEMKHLVSIAFPDFIRYRLFQRVAEETGVPERMVQRIADSLDYRVCLRKSLFLALSDGSHIDVFRRSNKALSHEQVVPFYDLSEAKADDLLSRLRDDLRRIVQSQEEASLARFQTVFLLDDFSGSGYSYFRREGDRYAGKVAKVLQAVSTPRTPLNKVVDAEGLHVCVVLYTATQLAMERIGQRLKEWVSSSDAGITFSTLVVQEIPNSVRITTEQDAGFYEMLPKHFDNQVVTKHFKQAKSEKPFEGFDQCALPLVLYHNTPNNSIPLLWFESEAPRGLFPRVARHKED